MSGQATREERLDRQDRDPGDLDDDVVATQRAYHDDDGCIHVQKADEQKINRDLTRREAQLRWLAPCSDCVLGGRE